MAQTKNTNSTNENLLPLMATAALQGAGADNNQIQELIGLLLKDQLAVREKEKQRKERLSLNSIAATAEAIAAKSGEQDRCPHLKQDNTSRLTGQRLSGTGQIALVCTYCHKEFHMPPQEGQVAPPRHLIPSADIIGG